MTTIEFPLYTYTDADGTAKFTDASFRFTIRTTRELERAAGCGVTMLQARAQTVEALVLMTCYGLRWNNKQMTEDKAVDLIDRFVDAGGDTAKLVKALVDALNASGVYGKPEDGEVADEETANPTKTPTPTAV